MFILITRIFFLGLIGIKFMSFKFIPGWQHFAHLFLDLRQVALGDGLSEFKIKIEPVINGRADSPLRIRPELHHRSGEQVGE